ncbi:MAG: SPFH domain-containing protein [Chloroflexota bacterium]
MESGIIGGVLAIVVFMGTLIFLPTLIRVCPSNHILVITGGTKTNVGGREYGFRLQKGGWTFIIPFIQSVEAIDLTIIPINVRIEGVNSANGINVGADATACVCIDDQNEVLLYSAVQQLLGKSRGQIQEQIKQTMIGNFRAALNKTTPLQAIGMVESADGVSDLEVVELSSKISSSDDADKEGERAIFRSVLLDDCQEDLSTFGIEVVSVSLQRIWDTSSYIANLANKTLSRKRKEVEIEEARLNARAERAESDGQRRMGVAVSQSNEHILNAKQEVELYRRECDAKIHRAKLEADSGIEEASSQGQQQVEVMNVELQQLRNRSEVTLAAEARRQAAEIIAAGEAESTEIVREAHNDLLKQKVELLSKSGDIGKAVLFLDQLPQLFASYQNSAQDMKVDSLLVLNDDEGFNSAVNRGPAALVDFLNQLESGFGISIKELMGSTSREKQLEQPVG